jgi:hypothetical protein
VNVVRDKAMVVLMRPETRLWLCSRGPKQGYMVVWMISETRGQYSCKEGCIENVSTVARMVVLKVMCIASWMVVLNRPCIAARVVVLMRPV